MKKSHLIAGVVCLALAVLAHASGLTKIVQAASPTIYIYPAAALAMGGAVLIFRSVKQ